MVPPGKLCPRPVSQLFKNMLSYDGNMMLAMAVISLILVVAFVFLLHVYAKWLLVQARNRSSGPSPGISDHHLNRYITYEISQPSDDIMMTFKGLDPSVIALIPVFVYNGEGAAVGLECVICMGQFEEKEAGRQLPNCGHSFHVECIDMWLLSHTNCPLCRSVVGLLIQCEEEEEEEGKEKFSYPDCPEVNSSLSNNNHNDVNGGSVLEIVIEVPAFVENKDDVHRNTIML